MKTKSFGAGAMFIKRRALDPEHFLRPLRCPVYRGTA